ncbi:hypothetical protein BDY17DRAFT_29785 [Neohortaea acidophila]|uniref:Uncharacterized protein n=1 Tax=Neohortaea acidophila TaxID=245834 RepID=A0A6A6PJ86_9PEZI|nr:uncharacterized protein BDY17DRAFT_29785 [Neohortaea acidophila]KAF2479985.1 hypothetical protein BDY17DRAFT_29785 [Neohortaea acidophila]
MSEIHVGPSVGLSKPGSLSRDFNTQNGVSSSIADEYHAKSETVPLHKMDISQQLRSMSQMSDTPANETPSHSAHASLSRIWQAHLGAPSAQSRHSRRLSSLDMRISGLTSPMNGGHVPLRDNTSSVYSRSASAAANDQDQTNALHFNTPRTSPVGWEEVLEDWPLKPEVSKPKLKSALRAEPKRSPGKKLRNKPLPPDPPEAVPSDNVTRKVSFETSALKSDNASVRLLSPPPPLREASIPSKSSSSTLTRLSKASRFLERFSPPKKTVQKRRSIFKFLRPGSQKQQNRCVSSPALVPNVSKTTTVAFDGQSDDPALLTVEYELNGQPSRVARSMSMNQLSPSAAETSRTHLEPNPGPAYALVRRPTLADYERSLTIAGDDRRRPSTVSLKRAKEVQEEDRRESGGGLRKRLSRARPLRDDASPLMAQALEKHQQEKALFRSAGKQRESAGGLDPLAFSDSSPFSRTGASLPPASLYNHNDLLDPLEKGHLKSHSERGFDHVYLAPPSPHHHAHSSRHSSPAASTRAPSTVASHMQPIREMLPLPPKARIGTNLESWSRYPSHTRGERCGSAGRADAIIARDFGIDINPEEIHVSDTAEDDDDSPGSKHSAKITPPRRRRTGLAQSRSFGGIVRYYSNLFHTRGWYGQNRRTSITTGGTLEYPELEMLPVQMAVDLPRHHHHHHPIEHLRDSIKEDAGKITAFVKDEEGKLDAFVKREEEVLEGFVRKEEDELEGFVKKEEQMFGEFVKREEGKLRDFVEGEEEAMLFHPHHRHHRPGSSTSRKSSPFRTGSIFEPPHHHRQDEGRLPRSETMVGPGDMARRSSTTPHHHGVTELDGNSCTQLSKKKQATLSKAELWSNVYKDCLERSTSTASAKDDIAIDEKRALLSKLDVDDALPSRNSSNNICNNDNILLTLEATRPRSPDIQVPTVVDPKEAPRIRRFPSVTVIDDRKGHFRSVSLISVRTNKSKTSGLEVERVESGQGLLLGGDEA